MLPASTGEARICLASPPREDSLMSPRPVLGNQKEGGERLAAPSRGSHHFPPEKEWGCRLKHSEAFPGPEGRNRAWEQSVAQSKGPWALFGDRAFREVIKVKCGPKDGTLVQ